AHRASGGLSVPVYDAGFRAESCGHRSREHLPVRRAQYVRVLRGAAHPGGRPPAHRAAVQPVEAVEAGTQAQGMTLSVIIITKNEAANIGACIDSVAFADEIIVLDSGSTDDTCRIALGKGAKVSSTDDWPGFGPQKNRALDLATGDWILSIDADERVTEDLAQEIQREMAVPRADAYRIPRLSNFCGRWIRHSGWWPDYVLRL